MTKHKKNRSEFGAVKIINQINYFKRIIFLVEVYLPPDFIL